METNGGKLKKERERGRINPYAIIPQKRIKKKEVKYSCFYYIYF